MSSVSPQVDVKNARLRKLQLAPQVATCTYSTQPARCANVCLVVRETIEPRVLRNCRSMPTLKMFSEPVGSTVRDFFPVKELTTAACPPAAAAPGDSFSTSLPALHPHHTVDARVFNGRLEPRLHPATHFCTFLTSRSISGRAAAHHSHMYSIGHG